MKRFWIFLLCACWLCSLVPASAEATPTVTTVPASNAALKVGDEITFTVQLDGVTSVNSMAVRIGYGFDAAVFSFVSGEWLVESTTIADVDEEKLNAVILKPKSCTGDVFRFTLRVREDAPSGTTQIKAGAVLGMEGGNQTPDEVGCTLTVMGAPTTATTTGSSTTSAALGGATGTTSDSSQGQATGTTAGSSTQSVAPGATTASTPEGVAGNGSTTASTIGTSGPSANPVGGDPADGEESNPVAPVLWTVLAVAAVMLAAAGVVALAWIYRKKG